jgi:hypothetical protein
MGNIASQDESFVGSEIGEEAFLVPYVIKGSDEEDLVRKVFDIRVKSGQSHAPATYVNPKLAIVEIQEMRTVNYETRELV